MPESELPEFGVFVRGVKKRTFDTRGEAADYMEGMDHAEIHEIDKSALRPELLPFERCRIEATDADGERVRFIVGRSTGWKPCHLEIKRRDAHGGGPVDSRGYTNVVLIERDVR